MIFPTMFPGKVSKIMKYCGKTKQAKNFISLNNAKTVPFPFLYFSEIQSKTPLPC